VSFELGPVDGEKSIFIRIWDAAGNEYRTNATRILLDMTPPTVSMTSLPPKSETLIFQVSWDGSDLLTGVSSYDVQYRSDGDWVRWLDGYRAGSINFSGQDGTAYFFRVRAMDGAGNTGEFAEAGPVSIVLPDTRPPKIIITKPMPGSVVNGGMDVKGTSSHPVSGKTVQKIQVRVDEGDWHDAGGTSSWAIKIDTKELADGRHVVRARADDGLTYSSVVEVNISVNNAAVQDPSGGAGNPMFIMIGSTAILTVLLVVVGLLFIRKRKPKGE
jgi:hypothetical protein